MISGSPEEVIVEMDVTSDQTQETGVVHGGLLSSLADASAANLFQPYVPDHLITTSIEFKISESFITDPPAVNRCRLFYL